MQTSISIAKELQKKASFSEVRAVWLIRPAAYLYQGAVTLIAERTIKRAGRNVLCGVCALAVQIYEYCICLHSSARGPAILIFWIHAN